MHRHQLATLIFLFAYSALVAHSELEVGSGDASGETASGSSAITASDDTAGGDADSASGFTATSSVTASGDTAGGDAASGDALGDLSSGSLIGDGFSGEDVGSGATFGSSDAGSGVDALGGLETVVTILEAPSDVSSMPVGEGSTVSVFATAFFVASDGRSLSAFWTAGQRDFAWEASGGTIQAVVDARAVDPRVRLANPEMTSGGQLPFTFEVGNTSAPTSRVVVGLDRASVGMRVGERRWVIIPPPEGFWSDGFPAHGNLGHRFARVPNASTIVFDMRCADVR